MAGMEITLIFINDILFLFFMLKNKKSKSHRMRGSSSHGWGHKKKHRGAGHRGGVGLSGTGKRGDAKKTSILSNAKSILKSISAKKGVKLSKLKAGNEYFGRRGFNSVHRKASNTMSLSYIEDNYDKMVSSKMIGNDVFDSTKYKIDKILGRGKFTRKLTVICNDISEPAKSQIEAAGGKVEVLGESEESPDSDE